MDAANLGVGAAGGDSQIERDIRAGEMQAKARAIKAKRDQMKTMRVIRKKDRMNGSSSASASLIPSSSDNKTEEQSPVSTSRQ